MDIMDLKNGKIKMHTKKDSPLWLTDQTVNFKTYNLFFTLKINQQFSMWWSATRAPNPQSTHPVTPLVSPDMWPKILHMKMTGRKWKTAEQKVGRNNTSF